MPLSTALPFGMRDCKIYPYTDAAGTTLAATGFDLPYAQTFSFADTEDFTDLRGDDDLVATHGAGAQVKWTLEAGGISLPVWAIFTGGQIIETGTTPNRVVTLRKCSDDTRPYFRVDGLIMSDSGGDVTATVYRAKCNGDISGQFGDGKFFVSSANGIGLPIPGTKLLYDIAQHETVNGLGDTPIANPIMPPKNVVASAITATGLTLTWSAVSGATAYKVEKAVSPFTTWTSAGADPATSTLAVTSLTTATAYQFRVSTKVGATYGSPGVPISVTTA
jgi:hypothetical protein